MIFLLIAGTYTPVGLLVLEGTLAAVVLAVVWGGAAAGGRARTRLDDGATLARRDRLPGACWVAVAAMPQLFTRLGVAGGLLLVVGGLVYSLGAAVYACAARTRCRPCSATTRSSTCW